MATFDLIYGCRFRGLRATDLFLLGPGNPRESAANDLLDPPVSDRAIEVQGTRTMAAYWSSICLILALCIFYDRLWVRTQRQKLPLVQSLFQWPDLTFSASSAFFAVKLC